MKSKSVTPTKKDILKWTAALRSGRYKQTTDSLQDGHGYCCLGVACKEFIPEEELRLTDDEAVISGELPIDQPEAPYWLRYINTEFAMITSLGLSDLNDNEDFTFDEIADVLEAVYVHKVLEE